MTTHSKVLVSGSAGFIGAALSQCLLDQGHVVVGFDNLCPYYSVQLKKQRNELLLRNPNYIFYEGDLRDRDFLLSLALKHRFKSVYHLAAQVGVRNSLNDPHSYFESNVTGTLNLLEAIRQAQTKTDLVLASSSSVFVFAY